MRKTPACIWLSPADRATLEGWVGERNTPQKLVWRARIVLLSADRVGVMRIARAIGKSKVTVGRWQERYLARGVAGLRRDATRPGRKTPLSAAVIEQVVQKTLQEKPPAGTHWSIRKMSAAVGISYTSVQRIWKAHGLKPHLVRSFKLSNDKHFVEKVQDVVGLYVDPPEKAVVFAVDEKSQIQALDRTQPGLPMKKGQAGTMTHDYKRNGTTTLFAALDVATGQVIGQCMPRHRHQEWLKFLRLLDQTMPAHLDLHLIGDNYATHKHPRSSAGCSATHVFICTSHPPAPRGSTWWSASSAISLRTGFAAAFFAISKNSSWRLEITSIVTTKTPSPSSGRLVPPTPWKRLNVLATPCINVVLNDALH